MFRGRTGGTPAKRLDCEEVESICEGLAIELLIIKGRGCAHGVDEDDCRLSSVNAVTGKLVANVNAAKMGHFDGCFASMLFIVFVTTSFAWY